MYDQLIQVNILRINVDFYVLLDFFYLHCCAWQCSSRNKLISNFRSNNNLTRGKLIMLSSFRWVKVLQCIRKTKASFLYEKQDLQEKQEWVF